MSYHYTDYEELEELRKFNQVLLIQNDELIKTIKELREIIKNGNNNTKPKTTRKTTKREM